MSLVAASLSDLRKLTITSHKGNDDVVRLNEQCLNAFGEHPFGADIIRPLSQLTSVSLDCYNHDHLIVYCLSLHAKDSWITSLSMTTREYFDQDVSCLKSLLKALNNGAFSKLKDLSIESCLFFEFLNNRSSHEENRMLILKAMLAYVTRRQLAVKFGEPFLRSLTLKTFSEKYDVMCSEIYKSFVHNNALTNKWTDELVDQL